MLVKMLRVRRLGAALLVVSFILPITARAQKPPLGEVARKEQERRRGVKSPSKVITSKDVPPAPPPQTPQASEPVQVPATPAEAADQKSQEPAKDEAWWKARITEARELLRRDEMFVEALQSRINALSTEFVNRDDPYQRAKIGEDRQKALAEMERVKAEIEQVKKQIADIEEEARRAGVPPGWLR